MPDFINLVKTSSKRHPFQLETANDLPNFIKDAFTLSTLLLIGAAIQAVLLLCLPVRVAVTPTVLAVISSAVYTSLQAADIIPSKYMKGVIPGKFSAQFPSPLNGRFGNVPASQAVVVFLLGVRINHPLGILAPGGKDIMSHFEKMNTAIAAQAEEFGTLGISHWRAADREDGNQILVIYYFRDLERLNQFAHAEVHRSGWDWYNRSKYPHLGIMHEAFCVPAGQYESMYANFHPTLMAATTVKVESEDSGGPMWVRPIVAANSGVLRSQFGRMGRSAGKEHEKYGAEPVWKGQHQG